MNSIRTAALAVALAAASGLAHAETTYTVDHVAITGSKSLPQAALLSAIKARPGAHMTKDEIVADQATLAKVLQDKHVVGAIKTSMAARGSHVDITFALDDQGVQGPVVTKVAPKLGQQVFAGNKKESTADLEAATGLKAGDTLTDARVQAAQAAIADVYRKRKKVNVSIQGSTKSDAQGRVEIDWQIDETKPQPKPAEKKDTSGYGGDNGQ